MSDPSGPRAGGGGPDRPPPGLDRAHLAAWWAAWWALSLGLWLLVTDTLSLAEALTGAGAAALAATAVELAQREARTHVAFRLSWFAAAARLPVRVASDTVVVFRALWDLVVHRRAPASRFSELPLPGVGGDSDLAATRRALHVAGRSLTPNTVVLGVDREREVLVVHELVPTGGGGQ